jgi:uncharacterized membrane protein
MQMLPPDIFWLSVAATVALAVMWVIFWIAVIRSNESIIQILSNPAFFRTVTVMGVIAATAVLSLAGKLDGNVTGAILSGIAGYVLGHLTSQKSDPPETKPE